MQLFFWFVRFVVCHLRIGCTLVAPLTVAVARQNWFFEARSVEREGEWLRSLPFLVSEIQTRVQGLSFLKVLKFRLFHWSFCSTVWVLRLKTSLQALSRYRIERSQDSIFSNCFHRESGHEVIQASSQGLWIGFVGFRICLRCRRAWSFQIRRGDQEVQQQEFIQWCSLLPSLHFLREVVSMRQRFFKSWKRWRQKQRTWLQENCMRSKTSLQIQLFDLYMWTEASGRKTKHKAEQKSRSVRRSHSRYYQEACSIWLILYSCLIFSVRSCCFRWLQGWIYGFS